MKKEGEICALIIYKVVDGLVIEGAQEEHPALQRAVHQSGILG